MLHYRYTITLFSGSYAIYAVRLFQKRVPVRYFGCVYPLCSYAFFGLVPPFLCICAVTPLTLRMCSYAPCCSYIQLRPCPLAVRICSYAICVWYTRYAQLHTPGRSNFLSVILYIHPTLTDDV